MPKDTVRGRPRDRVRWTRAHQGARSLSGEGLCWCPASRLERRRLRPAFPSSSHGPRSVTPVRRSGLLHPQPLTGLRRRTDVPLSTPPQRKKQVAWLTISPGDILRPRSGAGHGWEEYLPPRVPLRFASELHPWLSAMTPSGSGPARPARDAVSPADRPTRRSEYGTSQARERA